MRRIITVLVALAVLAGGWYAFSRYREGQRAAAMSNFQTVRAERGDLTASVGATGTVRANQTTILAWQTSGNVEKVNTVVGLRVAPNQVLAALKDTSLPQNVILANAELVNAQNDLQDLLEPASDLELAQAQQAIARAENALREAEQKLASLESTAKQVDIDQARANVVLAGHNLERAQEQFKPYENKKEDNLVRAALQSKVAQAQKDYDAAVQLLNNLLGTANTLDLEVAQADLEVARTELEQAKETYQELLAGPDPADIAGAEARIAAAQATADLKLITAPFASTVTEVNVKPGDQVAPGSMAFQLDDLSRLLVDVQVSEVDINRVQVGQQVNLTFDAILGKEYHGVVSQVALVGDATQGVVDFTVTVELADADQAVKPGMTAAVNVVVDKLEDVLLVPNRAVRVLDGQRVVYVMKNGVPEPVEIRLGASSETMSEVLEGELQAGDQIVLNPPTVFEQNGPGPFGQRR